MITLRPGCPEDASTLQALLAAYDMAGEIDPADCLLAVDLDGVVGFARLEWADRVPYLRPLVVAPASQRQGVGRRLVEALLADRAELRVVARGQAAPFYTALGFWAIDWDAVHPPFRRECERCPDRPTCQPVPMIIHAAKPAAKVRKNHA